MKVLISEDSESTRLLLTRMLTNAGFETIVTSDGADAWKLLGGPDIPQLALLDWMMPGLDGLELCRRMRANPKTRNIYTIILTMRDAQRDIVAGLKQGADDYITKPFDQEELLARIRAGVRIVQMQESLTNKIAELETALSLVKRLAGIIPICSYCKSVRNDDQYWQSVDEFITENSDVHFSHSICPDCFESIAQPMLAKAQADSLQREKTHVE